ncbi:ATP-binding protein [Streptomyces roseirectus]|uniref:ATP-binding protein n=1 Tax=Streptomyces roseirectus TaxID=2768066 RepID=A0A7H0IEL2_9ACTN|nr:ATP-binding protein [Streptomyces roseirectus]QNP71228.1 ATP-binding protein [Streptomyces roseirectus]
MPETPGSLTLPPDDKTWEYAVDIPNDLRAVSICRRTLRMTLTLYGLIHLVDTAELLATELLANALRHTNGPATLRICRDAGALRIGAWDTDPEPPDFTREFGELTEHGRGLALVRYCADVWGWKPLTRQGHRGKYVWCELGTA